MIQIITIFDRLPLELYIVHGLRRKEITPKIIPYINSSYITRERIFFEKNHEDDI